MANHTIDKFKYGNDTYVLQDNISGYLTEEEVKEQGYGIVVYDSMENGVSSTFEEVEQAYQDYNGKIAVKYLWPNYIDESMAVPMYFPLSGRDYAIVSEGDDPVDVYIFSGLALDTYEIWTNYTLVTNIWIADGHDWELYSDSLMDYNSVYDIILSSLKTVNSQSLVGSGDLPTKTINNESIWGSGNISITGETLLYKGSSSTASSTKTKVVTISQDQGTFSTTIRSLLFVTFSNPNTYSSDDDNLKLSVNNTTAKPVYYNGTVVSTSNPITWEAGETLTFINTSSEYIFISKTKYDNSSTWYCSCTSGATTTAKSANCSDYTLRKGNIVGVYFWYANTVDTPTLNINSTGAKAIMVGNASINGTTNVLKWSANTIVYFMYDGTNYQYITAVSASNVAPPRGANTWYGICSTADGTNAKVVTCDNFVLTKGALISVYCSTVNETIDAITLNVNSTGAKTVFYNGATTSSSNPLLWEIGEMLTFIYNGSSYYFIGRSKTASGGVTDVTVGGTSVVSSGVAAVPTVPTISLNGSSTTSPSFYAPTSVGTSGYYLKSNGSGAPIWEAITKFVENNYASGDLTLANSISNGSTGIALESVNAVAGNGVGIHMTPTTLSIGNETSSGGHFSISEKIGITNAGVVTVTGLATPTNNTDAATKKYVDDSIPTVPVTDVTVGGTSVVSSGTAIIPEEIFIAEYGVTTFQELVDAYEAGKTLFCKDTSVPDTEYILPLAFYDTQSAGYEYMQFSGFQDSSSSLNLIINADDTWSTESSSYSSATNWENGTGSYSVRMQASYASGSDSVAQNRGTTAQRKSQTALGEFNIADTSGTTTTRGDYAVIVGNGTSTSNRSNALTIDWDGNVVASGNATTSDMSNTDIANFLASLNIRGACPYMVGDIYITTNSVNPETIWADTEWDRIEDTFLLSAGSTYTAGDTGGSADAIVPYHTHTFTDHWKTYKLNTTSRKPGTSTAVNYGTSITASDATGSYTTDAPSGTTSGNTVGANMPPYLVVNVWVRTA